VRNRLIIMSVVLGAFLTHGCASGVSTRLSPSAVDRLAANQGLAAERRVVATQYVQPMELVVVEDQANALLIVSDRGRPIGIVNCPLKDKDRAGCETFGVEAKLYVAWGVVRDTSSQVMVSIDGQRHVIAVNHHGAFLFALPVKGEEFPSTLLILG